MSRVSEGLVWGQVTHWGRPQGKVPDSPSVGPVNEQIPVMLHRFEISAMLVKSGQENSNWNNVSSAPKKAESAGIVVA